MSERIDHADAAWRHLEDVTDYENDAHSYRFDDEQGRSVQALSHAGLSAQQAQVHATLALVEQQRIANLIALGQFRVGVSDLPHLRHLVIEPKDEWSIQPVAEIREALGIFSLGDFGEELRKTLEGEEQ